jgi:hypothetical protein
MWLTLYSPLVFEKASIDGAPETMSSGVEVGVNAFSSYVEVPPGATVTLRVRLAGQVASRGALSMAVRLQPAANPEHVVVEVTPAGAWSLATTNGSAYWSLSAAMRQRRVFRFVTSRLDHAAWPGKKRFLTSSEVNVTFAQVSTPLRP